MKIFKKIYQRLLSYILTFILKVNNEGFEVNGIFRGRIDTQIIIQESGKIELGKNVSFQRNVSISSIGGHLKIGSRVSFNRNCIIVCHKEITIKDDVIFGPGVTIYDHDHKFSEKGILPGYKYGPIIIEEGCWIASNVMILRNTRIGEGSVIGAGAIVQGDIPPHSLVISDRKLSINTIRKK